MHDIMADNIWNIFLYMLHKYTWKVYALYKKCKKSIISISLESFIRETNFCVGPIFCFIYYIS